LLRLAVKSSVVRGRSASVTRSVSEDDDEDDFFAAIESRTPRATPMSLQKRLLFIREPYSDPLCLF